jgi:hypothetical protein
MYAARIHSVQTGNRPVAMRFKQKSFKAHKKRLWKFGIIFMNVIEAFKERNYDETTLKKYNLSVVFDKKEQQGRLRFYIDVNDKKGGYTDWSPSSKIKYKHSFGLLTKNICFNYKPDVLYAFICEGVFDVLRLESFDYNAFGNMGVSLYKTQKLIKETDMFIVLAFDNDKTGIETTNKLVNWTICNCKERLQDLAILVYKTEAKDPDCFISRNDFTVITVFQYIVEKILKEEEKGYLNSNALKLAFFYTKHLGFEPFKKITTGWMPLLKELTEHNNETKKIGKIKSSFKI